MAATMYQPTSDFIFIQPRQIAANVGSLRTEREYSMPYCYGEKDSRNRSNDFLQRRGYQMIQKNNSANTRQGAKIRNVSLQLSAR